MFRKKGFTLVELLIVIIIVGILAAVAIPTMSGNVNKAKKSEAVAALGSIRTAIKMYQVEHVGNAITGLADLSSYIAGTDLNGKYYNCTDYTIVAATGTANNSNYGTDVVMTWTSGNITGG